VAECLEYGDEPLGFIVKLICLYIKTATNYYNRD
jgi:hypothetical protein